MARLFDGIDDVISGATPALDNLVAPVTVALWVFQTSTPANVDRWYTLTNERIVMRHDGAGAVGKAQFYVKVAGGVLVFLNVNGQVAAGSWAHFALTYDRVNLRMLKNGAQVGSVAETRELFAETGQTTSLSSAGESLPGRLAEVATWAALLSDAEITALAKGVPPSLVRPSAIKFYAPLYGAASPEPDLSGNAAVLTVTGATLIDHAPVGRYSPMPADALFVPPPEEALLAAEAALLGFYGPEEALLAAEAALLGFYGPEPALLAAEAALLGLESLRPADFGLLGAEAALLGIVDPELLNVLAEAALLGTDELNAPAPTSRIVRKTMRPVTWES